MPRMTLDSIVAHALFWSLLVGVPLSSGGCSYFFSQQRTVQLSAAPSRPALRDAIQQISGMRAAQEHEEHGHATWRFEFIDHAGFRGWIAERGEAGTIEAGVGVHAKRTSRLRQEADRLLSHMIRELEVLTASTAVPAG